MPCTSPQSSPPLGTLRLPTEGEGWVNRPWKPFGLLLFLLEELKIIRYGLSHTLSVGVARGYALEKSVWHSLEYCWGEDLGEVPLK